MTHESRESRSKTAVRTISDYDQFSKTAVRTISNYDQFTKVLRVGDQLEEATAGNGISWCPCKRQLVNEHLWHLKPSYINKIENNNSRKT
jgi:hypothetical protein